MTLCRSCRGTRLSTFLDLGNTPVANRLLSSDELTEPEPVYPLKVALCLDCSLVQIVETVDPGIIFPSDYPYYSSFSDAFLRHSRSLVIELIQSRNLSKESLVIELASNDGYLLQNYVDRGIRVLGIDPATGPSNAAALRGVPTMQCFFTSEVAEVLRANRKTADVVHANNVLAHVPDLNGFVAGIASILKDDGIAVIEAPYVRELIKHCEFDTIYHEHLCYFSVTSLHHLFRRHGLGIRNLGFEPVHGGSLRLYVEKATDGFGANVQKCLDEERDLGIGEEGYYANFALRVERLKTELLRLLRQLKDDGRSIAAYGAAAKGATMINFSEIGRDLVDFVVDRNNRKHGKYMPGQRIPIFPPEVLLSKSPDYLLILAWNFADEIISQQAEYQDQGGKFVVPVPWPRIV